MPALMLCYKQNLSPHRDIRQVSQKQMSQLLIKTFKQWGMPLAIRTDNGSPLGAPSRAVIPIMSLWLAAWGVRHILNRPRIPTDNPNVENNQATSARWAEIHTCKDLDQVEEKLEEAGHFQRDHFKVSRLGKVTRKALYERLYNNPRPFHKVKFEVNKAYQLLAQAIYPRKVSKNGNVSIYRKTFSVGAPNRGLTVLICFDPQQIAWVCKDQNKQVLKVLPDPRFEKKNLYNLTVYQ